MRSDDGRGENLEYWGSKEKVKKSKSPSRPDPVGVDSTGSRVTRR